MRERTISTVETELGWSISLNRRDDGTFALFMTGCSGKAAVQIPLTAKELDDLKALLARATAS